MNLKGRSASVVFCFCFCAASASTADAGTPSPQVEVRDKAAADASDPEVQAVTSAVTRLFGRSGGARLGGQLHVPQSTEIIARESHANMNVDPPAVGEGVLVVVQWKAPQSTWSLLHLTRLSESGGGWGRGYSNQAAQVQWKQDFSAEPTEAEAVQFLRSTAFGNNSASKVIVVRKIVAYRKDWKHFQEELANGIDDAEKIRRSKAPQPGSLDFGGLPSYGAKRSPPPAP